jgi:DNA repair protein RadD
MSHMTASDGAPGLRLRPYQLSTNALMKAELLVGSKSVLVVSPTGSGKGELIGFHAARLRAQGKSVLLLAPTREIAEQLSRTLTRWGVPHGRIAAGQPDTDDAVQVALVSSLSRPKRLERWRDRFDWILIDEAHHGIAETWSRVIARQSKARALIGYSATPERLDGRGLRDAFEAMVTGPSTAELIALAFLCGFIVYAPTVPNLDGVRTRAGDFALDDLSERMSGVVISAAVREYQRLCAGVSCVAFCVDRAHGRLVEAAFVAAGVKAKFIDGDTPHDERSDAIASLGTGDLDVLVNCNLVGEGVDVPAIGVVILLRPTQSLAMYLQQVGRALRIAPNKQRAVILDFAGNVARHGMPDAPRGWSLDAKPRRQRETVAPFSLRRCSECFTMNHFNTRTCVECGGDLTTRAERLEVDVRLQEANRRELEESVAAMPYRSAVSWAGEDRDKLKLVARARGYKPGWVWHKINEMRAKAG